VVSWVNRSPLGGQRRRRRDLFVGFGKDSASDGKDALHFRPDLKLRIRAAKRCCVH
jgi:hypothetical protein